MNNLIKRNYIEEFRAAFSAGVENIVKASNIYVEAIDENSQNAAAFLMEFGDIVPAGAWSQFEAIGRKWMHPKLLLNGGGKYGGRIKRLPYSTQEAIFEGRRFDLLTKTGDTLKVDLRECTSEQVDQLIDGSSIRNVSAQKAWLEARVMEPKNEPAEQMPYIISRGRVIFRRDVMMTKRELVRLVEEL